MGIMLNQVDNLFSYCSIQNGFQLNALEKFRHLKFDFVFCFPGFPFAESLDFRCGDSRQSINFLQFLDYFQELEAL